MLSQNKDGKITRALILVNCQNDFFENGSVPVPNASSILNNVKTLRQHNFDIVIHCQEWRPGNDSSFYSNNPGSKPNEIQHFVGGRTQTIHIDHCIQGSHGAKFHPELYVDPEDIIVRTGYNPEIDSYSAFRQSDRIVSINDSIQNNNSNNNNNNNNNNNGNQNRKYNMFTELQYHLRSNNVTHIYICGLGTDRTLQYTVLDAKENMHKAHVFFIEDASKPYDESKMFGVYEKFQRSRVILTKVHGNEISKIPLRYKAHIGIFDMNNNNDNNNDNTTGQKANIMKHALPTNVLDTKAWNTYYDKLLDELDDQMTLVELAYIRFRAKRLHATHEFPPLPKIEILQDIGIHSYEAIMASPLPRRQNVLEILCTTGDYDYLKLILNESIHIKDKPSDGSGTDGAEEEVPMLDINRLWKISNTTRTLLTLAMDTNYPGQRTYMLNLLLEYGKRIGNNAEYAVGSSSSSSSSTKKKPDYRHHQHHRNSRNYGGKSKTDKHQIDIDTQDKPNGKTALMHACCVADLSVVEILLDHGADTNLKSIYGRTALMFACETNTPANIEICRKILASVPTVMKRHRMLDDHDMEGWNCLHFASKSGMLVHLPWDTLLGGKMHAQSRLQFHRKTIEDLSVLHLSAWNNRLDVVKFIVSNDDDNDDDHKKNCIS